MLPDQVCVHFQTEHGLWKMVCSCVPAAGCPLGWLCGPEGLVLAMRSGLVSEVITQSIGNSIPPRRTLCSV